MLQEDSDNRMESKINAKILKIRTVKNYPQAHNHLLIGKALEITNTYVRLHCRTYHYGSIINGPKDVQSGELMIRMVPWNRIEVINELPSDFDYINSTIAADKNGKVAFIDKKHSCLINSGTKYEIKY